MRKTWFTLVCAAALACVGAGKATPYSLYYADGGRAVPMSWRRRPVRLYLSASVRTPPPNIKAGSDVEGAVRRALMRWESACGVRFVVEWTDEQSASAGAEGDGVSLVTLADTPENNSFFTGRGIGYTKLFFNRGTGEIVEADLVINPRQKFSTDGSPGTYDLESTLTHELGHLLGLDHSAEPGSVMREGQPINVPSRREQLNGRNLGVDDRAGARALYGEPDGTLNTAE
jgi:Matrixin